MSDEEPKIHIDEDWKSKVEREREEASREEADEAKESPDKELEESGLSLFDYLVSTLAAQTMFALGLVAEEGQEKVTIDLGTARHLVDSLMMLRDKTQGNLTKDEEKNLNEAIAELQRVFTVRSQQARETAMQKPGVDPNPSILDR